MISRLDRLQGRDIYENTALAKLNEVIDAVNNQQIQLNNHECRLLDLHSRLTALDDPTYHEVEPEPADPYAEQRKWIGKLCKFWDYDGEEKWFSTLEHIDKNSPYPYCASGDWWYKHCEPVGPDDDVIYRGE
jgi:hypothetical protein